MPHKTEFDLLGFYQALANQTRLRLLNLIGDREICVCEFVRVLDQPQPMISQHLACLRSAGLVEARREGKWMHYRIAAPTDPASAALLRQTLDCLSRDKSMQADLARLEKSCCTTA